MGTPDVVGLADVEKKYLGLKISNRSSHTPGFGVLPAVASTPISTKLIRHQLPKGKFTIGIGIYLAAILGNSFP